MQEQLNDKQMNFVQILLKQHFSNLQGLYHITQFFCSSRNKFLQVHVVETFY